jgi:hypothetical protein
MMIDMLRRELLQGFFLLVCMSAAVPTVLRPALLQATTSPDLQRRSLKLEMLDRSAYLTGDDDGDIFEESFGMTTSGGMRR